MPYTSQFVDQGQGLLQVGEGIITSEEVFEVAQALNRLPDEMRRLQFALLDFSEALELRITGEQLRDIVAENEVTSSLVSPGLIAVVAPRDQIYGLARMWQAYVERLNWTVGVFRTRVEALDWIHGAVPAAQLLQIGEN